MSEEQMARAENEYERLKDKVHNQYEEIKRYKNIIDEFINKFEDFIETMEYEKIYHSDLKELLNKLKELKGSDN